jgi:hypothetical protein
MGAFMDIYLSIMEIDNIAFSTTISIFLAENSKKTSLTISRIR